MLILEKNAYRIFTDSGEVQKEAYWFKVPCITLRDETEWVETVDTGWNTLAGCNPEQIVQAALEARPGVKKLPLMAMAGQRSGLWNCWGRAQG
ncbi:UDP-N-acetyl glucosamine 2-epimerase [Thermodesulfovibrionales bacterium]|nr:UDP-N-acetyl glucosamine 2-epimerase [Thermodesulfovibrionales bacterium]